MKKLFLLCILLIATKGSTQTIDLIDHSLKKSFLVRDTSGITLLDSNLYVDSIRITGSNGIGVSGSPVINPSGTIALSLGTITGATWHGNPIDLTTYVTGVLPYVSGGEQGSAPTSATTGSMTVNMTTAVITITPSGSCLFNASGGTDGQTATFIIVTSGSTSFTLQWNTNYKTIGTLATGTAAGKVFCVTFRYLGSQWFEISRTTAM